MSKEHNKKANFKNTKQENRKISNNSGSDEEVRSKTKEIISKRLGAIKELSNK